MAIINGTNSNDFLSGTAYGDTISGGLGNDILYGYAGNDILYGGSSNDLLSDGAGNDTVYGQDGDDSLFAGSGTNRLDGGAGEDVVFYSDATASVKVNLSIATAQNTGTGSGIDTLISIEGIWGSAFSDILSGNSVANRLYGNDGNDTLSGGDGNDTLLGGSGSDSISGGNGDDWIYGGISNDTINGGTGSDFAHYSDATAGVSVNLSITTAQSTGGAGTDTLIAIENLWGGDFADTLTGNSTDNDLYGGKGADVLNGGAGADSLSGEDGNDTLIGGAGEDGLFGDSGNDVFDFNSTSETGNTWLTADTIYDFLRGSDKIDLSTIDANTSAAGNQGFSAMSVGTTFSGSFTNTASLYYDQTFHVLYGNNDTDAGADFAISLVGVSNLSTADLVL